MNNLLLHGTLLCLFWKKDQCAKHLHVLHSVSRLKKTIKYLVQHCIWYGIAYWHTFLTNCPSTCDIVIFLVYKRNTENDRTTETNPAKGQNKSAFSIKCIQPDLKGSENKNSFYSGFIPFAMLTVKKGCLPTYPECNLNRYPFNDKHTRLAKRRGTNLPASST